MHVYKNWEISSTFNWISRWISSPFTPFFKQPRYASTAVEASIFSSKCWCAWEHDINAKNKNTTSINLKTRNWIKLDILSPGQQLENLRTNATQKTTKQDAKTEFRNTSRTQQRTDPHKILLHAIRSKHENGATSTSGCKHENIKVELSIQRGRWFNKKCLLSEWFPWVGLPKNPPHFWELDFYPSMDCWKVGNHLPDPTPSKNNAKNKRETWWNMMKHEWRGAPAKGKYSWKSSGDLGQVPCFSAYISHQMTWCNRFVFPNGSVATFGDLKHLPLKWSICSVPWMSQLSEELLVNLRNIFPIRSGAYNNHHNHIEKTQIVLRFV